MKYPIIHLPFLPVAGMALFPFILVKQARYKTDEVLINHEKIHLMQQLELLILLFYVVYLFNYLYNLIKYRNHDRAYNNIVFEREAYLMESDDAYLRSRSLWAWLGLPKC